MDWTTFEAVAGGLAARRHRGLHGAGRAAAAPAVPRHGPRRQGARAARRGHDQRAASGRRHSRGPARGRSRPARRQHRRRLRGGLRTRASAPRSRGSSRTCAVSTTDAGRVRVERTQSGSSSSPCAPTSASCPGSAGSPPNSARPSSSSATCWPTRRTCSTRRCTTTRARSLSGAAHDRPAPRWQLPAFDWDEQLGAALGKALVNSGPVSFFGAEPEATRSHCPSWRPTPAPSAGTAASARVRRCCTPYSCYVRGREKRILRWEVGRLPGGRSPRSGRRRSTSRSATGSGASTSRPAPTAARELAEANEEDCLGNPHPTCGDCLWARGVVRCA